MSLKILLTAYSVQGGYATLGQKLSSSDGLNRCVCVYVFVYACVCVSFCVLQRQSCDLIVKYKFAISIKNRTSVCRFLGQLLYTYVASYNILHWK